MKRLLILTAVLVAIAGARPALAHVSVTPKQAARGAVTAFSFTVPNEEAPAKTTQLEVFLPTGVPSQGVSAAPPPGWTYSVAAEPGSVRFSGGAIAGEDKATFGMTLLIPATIGDPQLVFKVLQTYDDGQVVRWIEVAGARPVELPHPAPVVTLTGAVATTVATATSTPRTTVAEEDGDDGGLAAPLILLAALFVGSIGAGLAIGVRRRAASR